MTDYTELKRLAEGALLHASDSYVLPSSLAFERAANPAAVLALIAENERLNSLLDQSMKATDRVHAMWHRRWKSATGSEYAIPSMSRDEEFDRLKADVEACGPCYRLSATIPASAKIKLR